MISARPKRPLFNWGKDLLKHLVGFVLLIYVLDPYQFSRTDWGVLCGFMLLWMVIEYRHKLNHYVKKTALSRIAINHIKPYAVFSLLLSICYLFFPESIFRNNRVIAFAIGFPVFVFLVNALILTINDWIKKSRENVRYTLVAGTGSIARQVEKQLGDRRISGYKIKGFVNCLQNEECAVGADKVVSNLKEIRQYLKENPVDEIVIALPGKPLKKIKNIVDTADYFGIRVKYIPDYRDMFGKNYKIVRYGDIDAISIRQYPIDGSFHSFAKSCFDKVFSFFTLILLTPLFLLLAVMIKLESPGPVFYCPIRIGKSGKPFRVYKFRSMRVNDTESNGTLSTQKDDPRITKWGKLMRKYSLDELPQFINVLLGEMSVVGPRPHRRFLDQQLQECVYRYMLRHYVKPGITGWAQVNGWRGPTDTEEQKKQRTLHDLWYLENWSFWLDLEIIFLTVFSKKAHRSAF